MDPSSSGSSYLNTALTYLSSTSRRLEDIRSFQLDRLKTCRSMGMWTELVGELKGDLENARRNLEIARELGESLRPRERGQVLSRVELLQNELTDLRIAYRENVVSSKKALASQKTQRNDIHELRSDSKSTETNGTLVTPGQSGHGEKRGRSRDRRGDMGDDALQTKTHDVTDALRRTTTLMQAELERSVLAVQTLDESTRTLRLTQSLYDNYTSLLTTSSQLVKALEKADWYDRLLILSAFILFLLVVGWVIKRRVLDKVVGGVGWWVGGSWKLVKMGLGQSAPKAVKVGKTKAVEAVNAGTGKVVDAAKLQSGVVSKVAETIVAGSGPAIPSTAVPIVALPSEQVVPRDEL